MADSAARQFFDWMAEGESSVLATTVSGGPLVVLGFLFFCGLFLFCLGVFGLIRPNPIGRRASRNWFQTTGKICDKCRYYRGSKGGHSRYSKSYYYVIAFRSPYGNEAVGFSQDFKGEPPFQTGQIVTIGMGPEMRKDPKPVQDLNSLLKSVLRRLFHLQEDQPDLRRRYHVRIMGDLARKREVKFLKVKALISLLLGIHTMLLPLVLYFKAFGG